MPLSNIFYTPKKSAPITSIYFDGPIDAMLTASDKKQADFVKRVLGALVSISEVDGGKKLDLELGTTEKDVNIKITGTAVLSTLKLLSQSAPPTFNKHSVTEVNKMLEQMQRCSPEERPLLCKKP